MSELFQPIAAEQLAEWVFAELDARESVFGISRRHFFEPRPGGPLRTAVFGQPLETPFGPAAGPHTQLAQNIVAAWLCGARYIELKTVQTLDELEVSKPCIDMEDEGYNVEWSQELKVYQSFDEYLRAWVLIHALHHKLGFHGSPGIVFNMSVGYDLAGIRQANVQWFLEQMQDCSAHKQALIDVVARHYPPVRDLSIPDRLSDNVTLSTMHGCPPGEIESISRYLLEERGLHTLVKCNPTLLGAERVRRILNDELQYADVVVPDVAFEHDLDYGDAVVMLGNLRKVAADHDLQFGVKLSNTLEVENTRAVFDGKDEMMYLSGRPLHAITVNLAHELAETFAGELPMSFSAGANCFNAADLLAAGMQTVTTCTDLLKTGGYMRLLQYVENTEGALARAGVQDIEAFIVATAQGDPAMDDAGTAARLNLRRYAERTRGDSQYVKGTFDTAHTKSRRTLEWFDCIRAPCMEECPLHQNVPGYMAAVRDGEFSAALDVVLADNPIPCVLGRVCDHLCEQLCVRNHLDEPLAIRDVKRFITDETPRPRSNRSPATNPMRVAIIGAGPGGMAAAIDLARAGVAVEVFEQYAYGGGMVGGAVPEYRLPQAVFDRDFDTLRELGVNVHFGSKAGRDFSLTTLQSEGFDAVVIMVGAQLSKTLQLDGEDCDGVMDALQFLRRSREGNPIAAGERVGVIGAGDTAMDCARVAQRQSGGDVRIVYRRTVDQMPADREEISHLLEEGIEVLELVKPQRLHVEDGKLKGLVCRRMAYRGDRDASGRKVPHELPDSDFELPLDTLILAISQHAVLDFFDGQSIALNARGYIDADPVTFETSVANVYAGGDVANAGPASIVKAAAAGRAIAASILRREVPTEPAQPDRIVDVAELRRQRSHRQWRVAAPQRPLAERHDFREVVLTYAPDQARTEAARCLDCDTYCSLCVGVCPNLALLTYEIEPGDQPGTAAQRYQVAVLADLCNECGNCRTFCPTAGAPYRDKPRLFLDRGEFEQQRDNAFMISRANGGWAIDARLDGRAHRVTCDEQLDYTGGDPVGEGPGAAMLVLLRGLRRSLPEVPVALPGDDPGVRVGHPGYRD